MWKQIRWGCHHQKSQAHDKVFLIHGGRIPTSAPAISNSNSAGVVFFFLQPFLFFLTVLRVKKFFFTKKGTGTRSVHSTSGVSETSVAKSLNEKIDLAIEHIYSPKS